MRNKYLKILSFVYFAAAIATVVLWLINVIIGDLLQPLDSTDSFGITVVCTLAEPLMATLMVLIGVDLLKDFTVSTLKKGVALFALSLFAFLFVILGHYTIIPETLGILLPAITLFLVR